MATKKDTGPKAGKPRSPKRAGKQENRMARTESRDPNTGPENDKLPEGQKPPTTSKS